MKLLTICGTRPEIIRLSRLIPLLDEAVGARNHTLLYTDQNFSPSLKDVFFEELGVRQPDITLGLGRDSFGKQVGLVLDGVASALQDKKPDGVLILGDTTSGMGAVEARRNGIPVFHMEAGNRCHDFRVPEETNRRIIDACSTLLLPYTERSRQNLLAEGYADRHIFVTGNPINEVLQGVSSNGVPLPYGLHSKSFVLLTLHRTENTDRPEVLAALLDAARGVARDLDVPLVFPAHPRTHDKLQQLGTPPQGMVEALSFKEFLRLEESALLVLTDSGTVPEECCLLNVPSVTLRDSTERPEMLEVGSTILGGTGPEGILRAARVMMGRPCTSWQPPEEYTRRGVAENVVGIILSHLQTEHGL